MAEQVFCRLAIFPQWSLPCGFPLQLLSSLLYLDLVVLMLRCSLSVQDSSFPLSCEDPVCSRLVAMAVQMVFVLGRTHQGFNCCMGVHVCGYWPKGIAKHYTN